MELLEKNGKSYDAVGPVSMTAFGLIGLRSSPAQSATAMSSSQRALAAFAGLFANLLYLPSLPTPLHYLLRLFTITNLSVLFTPLTSTSISYPLHSVPTSLCSCRFDSIPFEIRSIIAYHCHLSTQPKNILYFCFHPMPSLPTDHPCPVHQIRLTPYVEGGG